MHSSKKSFNVEAEVKTLFHYNKIAVCQLQGIIVKRKYVYGNYGYT